MVLTTRNVEPVAIPAQAYTQRPEQVLDHVSGQKLIGLFRQINQLSSFAADIFGGLLKEASGTAARVSALATRVNSIESTMPQIQHIYSTSKPSHFYGGVKPIHEFVRAEAPKKTLFETDNLPATIARVRAQAQPPPQLQLLDPYAGKNCLAQYSDPSFFLGQWLKAEEEEQAKVYAEKQAKKKERQARRGKKNANAQNRVKTVAAVAIKTYSAQGKEFADPAAQQQQQQYEVQLPQIFSPEQDADVDAFVSPVAVTANAQQPQQQQQQQMAKPQAPQVPALPNMPPPSLPPPVLPPPVLPAADQRNASFAQPPPVYAQPPPVAPPPVFSQPPPIVPPPVARVMKAPPPVPMAAGAAAASSQYDEQQPSKSAVSAAVPMAPPMEIPTAPPVNIPIPPPLNIPNAPPPTIPQAPPAPVLNVDAPTAASPPAAVSPPGSMSSRTDLLSAIRAGAQLKKAAPAPPPVASGRQGMLQEIKNRSVVLKKVDDKKEEKKAAPAPMSGAAASIAAVLARRSAITGDDDDDSGDEGDDWD